MDNIKSTYFISKSYINFNDPLERWRQMSDIMQGNYFISNQGRVMRMTPNGIFKSLTLFLKRNRMNVCLYDHKEKIGRHGSVAAFVMKYFIGGYYPLRRFSFKNKDYKDCRLINLYWSYGFDNGIDYDYLKNINRRVLNVDDIKVVDYFFKKDIEILFELVNMHKNQLKQHLHAKNLFYNIDENISSIVLEISDNFKEGKYKPVSNRVTYKKQDFYEFLRNIVMALASKEKKFSVLRPEGISQDAFLDFMHHNNAI